MTIRLCSAVLGTVLLVWSFTSEGLPADTDAAKGVAQIRDVRAPAVDEKTLADARTKREKAQAELDAVSKPRALAAGTPPGTPQEELLERRSLLHHIVRSLDEQIDKRGLRFDQDLGQDVVSTGQKRRKDDVTPFSQIRADVV